MADPFAAALGALHRAPGSAAADYFIGGAGPAIPLRVVWDQASQTAQLGETEIVLDAMRLIVQRADVARPAVGDIVELANGDRYRVAGDPRLDAEGVSWPLDVEALP